MNGLSYRDYLLRFLTIVLALALLVLFWQVAEVFFLLFFSGLLAIVIRTVSKPLSSRTRLSDKAAVVVVTLALIALIGLASFFLVPRLVEEAEQFVEQLPQILVEVEGFIAGLPLGASLLEQWPILDSLQQRASDNATQAPSNENDDGMSFGVSQMLETFSAAFDMLFLLLLVPFATIFLAYDPELYRGGLLKLVPKDKRARAREVIDVTVLTLRYWLLGRVMAMAGVGILVTLGLWFLGVPMALFLGFLAGLLDFIPLIGPWLAAAPAVVFAFVQDPMLGLWVVLLYTAVQQVESFAITPVAQQWAVHLPPVLTITVLLIMHLLFGVMGALVATPLTAAAMVMVKMLYIEDALNDDVEIEAVKKQQS